MAKVIKRHSYKVLAMVLVVSMFGFYFSLIERGQAAQVTNRSDTLSNANASATSNHLFTFTLQDSLDTTSFTESSGASASDTLVVTIASDFTMGGVDCGDVDISFGDIATSISSGISGGDHGNRTNCPGSTTAWGLFINGSVLTFYTPTTVRTHVTTSTIMRVRIGSNATFDDGSNGVTGNEWITNPASIGTKSMVITGTSSASGTILVAIITGVDVSATVAETLTFTVVGISGLSGVAGAGPIMNACVEDIPGGTDADDEDAVSLVLVTTTAASVPYGTITSGSVYQGCQKLSITTNAGGGYAIRTRESSLLRTPGGITIPNANCDGDGCLNTPSTAAAWTLAGSGTGFGISCTDQTTSINCSAGAAELGPDFGSGTLGGNQWAPIANLLAYDGTQQPARFSALTGATSVEVLAKAKFRIEITASQGAGVYTNTISYIATPVF